MLDRLDYRRDRRGVESAPGHQLDLRRERPDRDLVAALDGHDTVIHLASNPDIARAVTDPAVDFDQGTLLTVGQAAEAGVLREVRPGTRLDSS